MGSSETNEWASVIAGDVGVDVSSVTFHATYCVAVKQLNGQYSNS